MKQPRTIRYGKGPRSHEWGQWLHGVWRCPWCDGFVKSERKPDPEAHAKSYDSFEWLSANPVASDETKAAKGE